MSGTSPHAVHRRGLLRGKPTSYLVRRRNLRQPSAIQQHSRTVKVRSGSRSDPKNCTLHVAFHARTPQRYGFGAKTSRFANVPLRHLRCRCFA